MRVCLINPPHPYLKQPTSQAPLGLLYVAAALREGGVEVGVLDLSDCRYDEEFEIPEADLYGITGTVIDRVPVMTVAKAIKEQRGSKAPVIVGGPLSLTPEYLDRTYIDSVIVGEGERAIFDVIKDLPDLKPQYQAERIIDLDTVPFPARDLIGNLGGNIFAFNQNYREGGSTVIITSRGCPYNCAFCASPGIWKRKVVFRSVENVLAEVDEIKEKYGITQLRFSDDTFTLRRERLKAMCQGLKERDVVWRASIRCVPNDLEMFQMMKEAGCQEVSFGVESADPDVLEKVAKDISPEDSRAALQNAKAAGLTVRILFMIGTPGETDQTVNRNIEFLSEVEDSYDTIALTTFIPIPGSAIANDPAAFDCEILDRDIDHYNFYLWGPQGENEWRDLISLNAIDLDMMRRNRERMKQFIIESGKSNKG